MTLGVIQFDRLEHMSWYARQKVFAQIDNESILIRTRFGFLFEVLKDKYGGIRITNGTCSAVCNTPSEAFAFIALFDKPKTKNARHTVATI